MASTSISWSSKLLAPIAEWQCLFHTLSKSFPRNPCYLSHPATKYNTTDYYLWKEINETYHILLNILFIIKKKVHISQLNIQNMMTYVNDNGTFVLEVFNNGILGRVKRSWPNKQISGVCWDEAFLGHKFAYETCCSDDENTTLGGHGWWWSYHASGILNIERVMLWWQFGHAIPKGC